MKNKSDIEILRKFYIDNPCKILPNSFWKTYSKIEKKKAAIQVNSKQIKIFSDNQLLTYFHTKGELNLSDNDYNKIDLFCIHNDYVEQFRLNNLNTQIYFRKIIYKNELPPPVQISDKFRLREIDITSEIELNALANQISSSYESLNLKINTIKQWLTHPVFKKELWICIEDISNELIVASGIAEIDEKIHECSLEWIQVLPQYQGFGLGKAIVRELLSRVEKKVMFTTVSGKHDENYSLNQFYESCGFKGNDLWWIFRKK